MKITVAQINPVVGAIEDNVARVLAIIDSVADQRPQLVVFPEMTVTGYPPRDLLERPAFIEQARDGLARIERASKKYAGLGIVVGCPVLTGESDGKPLHNSVFLVSDGRVRFEQAKILLPMYDVFDEARYFTPGRDNSVFEFAGRRLGLSVCEDLWYEPDPWNGQPYACNPIEMLAEKGAELVINISASPFSVGKEQVRYDLIRRHATKHKLDFLFVNQVGGNDELVFDGCSLFVGRTGEARNVFPSFEESTQTIDTDAPGDGKPYEFENDIDAIRRALVLGTRDYVGKCGFSKVVVGLSGGIDSAVVAVIASHALGAENVVLLSMPSPYSSPGSVDDGRELASNLGAKFEVVPIHDIMSAYGGALGNVFGAPPDGVAAENIQARIRGNLVMAFSNAFGYLPLSTGNKSELSVGYCTLYGDMSGGLAVISDVPKTVVYKLARRINEAGALIPQRIIDKPPSAELKPDQLDQDMLPPYEILDAILERYVDRQWSFKRIVEDGFDETIVTWVVGAIRKNEYKRKQAAPGIKVTSKAFGIGRRVPIAAKYDA